MSDIGKHWRVTVVVQEVTPAQPGRPGPQGISGTERRVHEVAGVNVAAASEAEAFGRAISALQALRPQMSAEQVNALKNEINAKVNAGSDPLPPHHFPGER